MQNRLLLVSNSQENDRSIGSRTWINDIPLDFVNLEYKFSCEKGHISQSH